MSKCSVRYFNDSQTGELYWQCPIRMGNKAIQPASAKRCWRYNCKGVKPPPPTIFCEVTECTNLKKSHKDSKYCSDRCAAKQRKRRWRAKKKNESLPVSPTVSL